MPSDIRIITLSDDAYPPLLREIHQPPRQLYLRGNPAVLEHPNLLAVVGSRKASPYGKQALEKILTPVVQTGAILVSGLAYGIDALAHRLCTDTAAPTIAVLGSGIDDQSIYPRSHAALAAAILRADGAILSEYPLGAPPHKGHFPARNRIIAGLTRATLVVQAAVKSGSLITARLALESGRDVAAVPGDITEPLSEGTNRLIQQGATPALNAQDMFDLLDITPAKQHTQTTSRLTKQQRQLLEHLSHDPQHVDQLAQHTGKSASAISVTLMELELAGAIANTGGMKYVRK